MDNGVDNEGDGATEDDADNGVGATDDDVDGEGNGVADDNDANDDDIDIAARNQVRTCTMANYVS